MECYSGKGISREIIWKKNTKTLIASLEFIQKFFLFSNIYHFPLYSGISYKMNNKKKN